MSYEIKVGPDYLLLEISDGSFELYRVAGHELDILEIRLMAMRAVDASRLERRAA